MMRYRDVIERELYTARRKRAANLRASNSTAKAKTADLCNTIAASLASKIGRLEAELAVAPERPRDNSGSFQRRAGVLDSIGIHYGASMPSIAEIEAVGDSLDIPAFLRR
ncbi:MAG: hypothetical protein ACRECA_13945 [Pseudolabrys sp.]